jgi:spore coat protein U-like protein
MASRRLFDGAQIELALLPIEVAAGSAISGQTTLTFTPAGELLGDGVLIGATTLTFTTLADLTGSGSAGDIDGTTTLIFTPSATAFGDAVIEAASTVTFTTAGDLTGSGASGDISGATSLTFALSGALAGETIVSGAASLTFTASATVTPEVGQQTGGDDAPARTEDIRRIAKREKRRQRLEDERERRFRQALQAAYEAAEGLAETEAPSARVDVQEALADARKAAPEDFRAEVAALDRQARNLATIDRISALLSGIAELQARAWADDDDLTVLLMVM